MLTKEQIISLSSQLQNIGWRKFFYSKDLTLALNTINLLEEDAHGEVAALFYRGFVANRWKMRLLTWPYAAIDLQKIDADPVVQLCSKAYVAGPTLISAKTLALFIDYPDAFAGLSTSALKSLLSHKDVASLAPIFASLQKSGLRSQENMQYFLKCDTESLLVFCTYASFGVFTLLSPERLVSLKNSDKNHVIPILKLLHDRKALQAFLQSPEHFEQLINSDNRDIVLKIMQHVQDYLPAFIEDKVTVQNLINIDAGSFKKHMARLQRLEAFTSASLQQLFTHIVLHFAPEDAFFTKITHLKDAGLLSEDIFAHLLPDVGALEDKTLHFIDALDELCSLPKIFRSKECIDALWASPSSNLVNFFKTMQSIGIEDKKTIAAWVGTVSDSLDYRLLNRQLMALHQEGGLAGLDKSPGALDILLRGEVSDYDFYTLQSAGLLKNARIAAFCLQALQEPLSCTAADLQALAAKNLLLVDDQMLAAICVKNASNAQALDLLQRLKEKNIWDGAFIEQAIKPLLRLSDPKQVDTALEALSTLYQSPDIFIINSDNLSKIFQHQEAPLLALVLQKMQKCKILDQRNFDNLLAAESQKNLVELAKILDILHAGDIKVTQNIFIELLRRAQESLKLLLTVLQTLKNCDGLGESVGYIIFSAVDLSALSKLFTQIGPVLKQHKNDNWMQDVVRKDKDSLLLLAKLVPELPCERTPPSSPRTITTVFFDSVDTESKPSSVWMEEILAHKHPSIINKLLKHLPHCTNKAAYINFILSHHNPETLAQVFTETGVDILQTPFATQKIAIISILLQKHQWNDDSRSMFYWLSESKDKKRLLAWGAEELGKLSGDNISHIVQCINFLQYYTWFNEPSQYARVLRLPTATLERLALCLDLLNNGALESKKTENLLYSLLQCEEKDLAALLLKFNNIMSVQDEKRERIIDAINTLSDRTNIEGLQTLLELPAVATKTFSPLFFITDTEQETAVPTQLVQVPAVKDLIETVAEHAQILGETGAWWLNTLSKTGTQSFATMTAMVAAMSDLDAMRENMNDEQQDDIDNKPVVKNNR